MGVSAILPVKVHRVFSNQTRKKFYSDSFESLIITDDGDVCAYSFCYV